MQRTSLLASLAALTVLSLAGCGDDSDPLATEPDDSATPSEDAGADQSLTVGSANFPENQLLMEIYAGALEDAGLTVETTPNIGSRETYIPGLQDGSIDVIAEYTGNLRLYFNPDAKASDSEEVYAELQEALPEDLSVLDYAEAQDKDSVVVTQDTADEYSLSAIGDLAEVAGDLTLGGPPEWKTRQTGVPGLRDVYGVEFGSFVATDAGGPLTLKALTQGRIDAGNLFSTDPNIAANDLVVLEDPDSLFAAQNVVPLIATSADSPEVQEALNGVSAELDTDTLGDLVTRVVIDKEDPADVAADFLADLG